MGAAAGNFMGALMGQLQPQIEQREKDKQQSKQQMRDVLLKGMQTDPPRNEGESDTDYNQRILAYHQRLQDEYQKTLHHPGAKELVQKAGQALGLYHKMGTPGAMPQAPPSTPSTTGPPVSGLPSPIAAPQASAGGAASLPPIPGLNVNAGGFETGAGSPAMPSTQKPVGPTASPAPLGAAPNAPAPPAAPITPIPAPTMPPKAAVAAPVAAKPAQVPTVPAAFDYGGQQVINNQAALANLQREVAYRKKLGEQLGLSGPDLAEFSYKGTVPAGADRIVNLSPDWAKEHAPWLSPDNEGHYRIPLSNAMQLLTGGPGTPTQIEVKDAEGKVHEMAAIYYKNAGIWKTTGGVQIDPDSIVSTKASTQRPVAYAHMIVSPEQAKAGIQSKFYKEDEFKRRDGSIIDVNNIPKGEVLQLQQQAGKEWYETRNLNDVFKNIGGVVHAVSPTEAENPQAYVPLGQSGANRSTTRSIVMLDSEGRAHTVSVPGSSTQRPTGMFQGTGVDFQAPPAGTPPPATSGAGSHGAKPAVPAVPKQSAAKPAAAANQGTGGMGDMMTPAIWKDSANKVSKILEGKTATDRLAQYADLADESKNPGAPERLGAAFNIALREWDKEMALPGVVNNLVNEAGARQAFAEAQAKVYSDAVKNLTPRERDYFNAMMSAIPAQMAARFLTGGNATNMGAAALENELPFIGNRASVSDPKGFIDKLNNIRSIYRAGVPTVAAPMRKTKAYDLTDIPNLEYKGPQPSPNSKLNAPGQVSADWKQKAKAAKIGDTIDTPRGKAKKVGEDKYQLVTQ